MGRRRKCSLKASPIIEHKEDHDSEKSQLNDSQEKAHTNAFQVMMDSRNKSIGGNSPGKEMPNNEIESEEVIEKRVIKARRMLSLQKMSEAKGSLKNKEIEEYRDRHIKKQMLKRAESFKKMVTLDKPKVDKKKKGKVEEKKQSPAKVEIVDDSDEETCTIDVKKTLQLCNMFEASDAEVHKQKTDKKKISKEDKEFLSKLSPSIRKKENMMSYFHKVPKITEEHLHEENSKDIIKVKLKSRHKKKKSLPNRNKRNCESDESNLEKELDHGISGNLTSDLTETRPKRNIKRPAKYDDNDLVSSDDDLHIFTPKKKKNVESHKNLQVKDKEIQSNNQLDINSDKNFNSSLKDSVKKGMHDKKNSEHKDCNSKSKPITKTTNEIKTMNPVKLAPIFVAKSSNLSLAEREAKQKFLQSGIPEKLKKSYAQQQYMSLVENFHSVVHVQQLTKKDSSNNEVQYATYNDDDEMDLVEEESIHKILIALIDCGAEDKMSIAFKTANKEELLQTLKRSYEKFPVYRTYHLLKGKSRGEFRDVNYPDLDNSIEIINNIPNDTVSIDKLCWVDKYKPTSSKQIIGNFSAIDDLKKWLQSWTESLLKSKTNTKSDGSDFDDFQESDGDSREAIRNYNNLLIISGDVGSGKTSSVYAVAAELAIKVIEVNASSKRTGKIMLQDLQEATRSHKVDRGKTYLDNSQKVQELKPKLHNKKRGRPKKPKEDLSKEGPSHSTKNSLIEQTLSQESMRTDSSLILIDDADIVFDQDDGFCSAVSQLIHSSKRPVILVTSTLSCPHLQKFIQQGKIIKMHRFIPRMLGIWLDIMCIADMGTCFPGLGSSLLDIFKGDMRKTIHCLQFYMASFKHSSKSDSQSQDISEKLGIEDESSSLSWVDNEVAIKPVTCMPDATKNSILQHIAKICLGTPQDFLNIWWSIPKRFYQDCQRNSVKQSAIASLLNTISEADIYLSQCKRNKSSKNIWCPRETPSLNECENYESFNRNEELSSGIAHELINLSLTQAEKVFSEETSIDANTFKPEYIQERDWEKAVSRHHTLTTYLNPGVILDRRALALDYWPSCRTICRLEKNKTDNIKRNNRFCHYLKSLNVLCKNDYFDALSKSLDTSELT